jgi:DNA-binding Lrp family transcriptional regulator
MRAVFVMIKTEPQHTLDVAARIADLETFSEAFSISGQYDILAKLYVENFDDLGHLIIEQIQAIPGVRDTFTILTFRAFG